MSANPAVRAEAPWLDHAPESDYATFLSSVPSDLGNDKLKTRRQFVRAYPDLSAWLYAPLAERVGSTTPRRRLAYICARSRPYLYFLVLDQRLQLDWPWILAINYHELPPKLLPNPVNAYVDSLAAQAAQIGYSSKRPLRRLIKYLHLHNPGRAHQLTEADLADFEQALTAFGDHPDRPRFFGTQEAWQSAFAEHRRSLFMLRTLLYHRHATASLPRKLSPRQRRLYAPPRMAALLERYLEARRAQQSRPATISGIDAYVRHFTNWVAATYPTVEAFSDVTRDHVLAYAAALQTNATAGSSAISIATKSGRLSTLSVFLRDTAAWGWQDAPTHFLISARDLPKRIEQLPRYIPADELERLMPAIRRLACPYQRTALIIARWSGARRSEIRNLEFHCLDEYADGTPRLRIPAGKTGAERLIPLHEEAAVAIRELQARDTGARGFRGSWGEREARRLFVRRGRTLGPGYLFEVPLATSCTEAGLLESRGGLRITAHRFRHTVGTELAEGGARLQTIMKMLGHTSTGMTLVYAHLTDATVRDDYLKVLGPGAQIAGPLAATLRASAMPRESIDWLKVNFFRTELELGHCLRLPHEGPCECDLYLTCAKFITTSDYTPRLRARRLRELTLVEEARAQGWEREVERHTCVMRRIEQLLAELNEPLEETPMELADRPGGSTGTSPAARSACALIRATRAAGSLLWTTRTILICKNKDTKRLNVHITENEALPDGSRPTVWFAFDETRPLAFFAGIWTRWTSVRKVKEGETTNDIFAFLTTEPNKEVGAIHPKAMPVILTAREEIDVWMNAPAEEALKLQRPLADNSLKIVARGDKKDEGGLAA